MKIVEAYHSISFLEGELNYDLENFFSFEEVRLSGSHVWLDNQIIFQLAPVHAFNK